MRKTTIGLLWLVSAFGTGITLANDNIAIDLSVSGEITPGVYGRVNIGNSHPEMVYEQPIIVKKVKHSSDPIYLVVPPGHAKHWDKHCAEYNACDRRVYFVKSHEYDEDHSRNNKKERHNKKVSEREHDDGDENDRDQNDHDRDDHDDGRHDHGHGHGRD